MKAVKADMTAAQKRSRGSAGQHPTGSLHPPSRRKRIPVAALGMLVAHFGLRAYDKKTREGLRFSLAADSALIAEKSAL